MRLVALTYAVVALGFVLLADTGHLAILLWKIETFVPHGDLYAHALAAGLFSLLANLALEGRTVNVSGLSLGLGTLIALGLGGLEELVQAITPHRTFSLLDFAANATGALAFGALGARLAKRRAAPATLPTETD